MPLTDAATAAAASAAEDKKTAAAAAAVQRSWTDGRQLAGWLLLAACRVIIAGHCSASSPPATSSP